MGFLLNEYRCHLVDTSRNLGGSMAGLADSTGKVIVLNPGSPTSPTVFSDAQATALGLTGGLAVVSFQNGAVRFYTLDTVTSIDLTGVTADGRAIGIQGLTPNAQHVIPINPLSSQQLLAVPFGASNAVETDTGLDLPAGCVLHPSSVFLRVTSADATETIDIGLLSSESGGDADGLVALATVATAGWVNLWPTINNGATIDFTNGNTFGALLGNSITGSDAVATCGGFYPRSHRTDGVAKSISWTGSAGSDTAAGYAYLGYHKLAF